MSDTEQNEGSSTSVADTTPVTTTTPKETVAKKTSNYKAPAKGEFPVRFDLGNQKPIEQLSFFDIFLWRNLFVSGVLFLLVQAVYLLLTRYQFSVITLVGRVVQIQVVVFFLYIVFARIVKNTSGSIVLPLTDFKVSKELLEPYVHAIVEKFNSLVSCYVDILMCKDLLKTIQFIVVVQLVCIVGKKVEGLNSAYALLNILFVVPLIYEWQQEKIDGAFMQAWAKVKQLLDQGLTKVPPNIKTQVVAIVDKIQGGKQKSQ